MPLARGAVTMARGGHGGSSGTERAMTTQDRTRVASGESRPTRTAQLNIHPNDIALVPHLLPHQIRMWAPQVDRIHVTLDTHGSVAGHYRAVGMGEKLASMRALLDSLMADEPKLRVDEVDGSPEARREVAQAFFGRDDVPLKAWHGGPFYAYLYGLHRADADVIVHFDGDMLFGGGDPGWLDEATGVLRRTPDTLFVGPLPGPPLPDGALIGHGVHWRGVRHEPVDGLPYPAHRFDTVSTRIMVLAPALLRERLGGPIPWRRPDLRRRVHARLLGNPPDTLNLERSLSVTMRERGLGRIDMLGSGDGMWSLHPPYRSAEFVARLPEFVDRVERGDVPDGQRGRYDLGEPWIDWSEARRLKSRPVRWRGHARRVGERLSHAALRGRANAAR